MGHCRITTRWRHHETRCLLVGCRRSEFYTLSVIPSRFPVARAIGHWSALRETRAKKLRAVVLCCFHGVPYLLPRESQRPSLRSLDLDHTEIPFPDARMPAPVAQIAERAEQQGLSSSRIPGRWVSPSPALSVDDPPSTSLLRISSLVCPVAWNGQIHPISCQLVGIRALIRQGLLQIHVRIKGQIMSNWRGGGLIGEGPSAHEPISFNHLILSRKRHQWLAVIRDISFGLITSLFTGISWHFSINGKLIFADSAIQVADVPLLTGSEVSFFYPPNCPTELIDSVS